MKRTAILLLIYFFATGIFAQTSAELLAAGIEKKDDGDCIRAIVDYKAALAKDASNGEAAYEAGWCLNDLERYDEAITFLEQSNMLQPGYSKTQFELGYAYKNLDNSTQALAHYKNALEIKPDYYDVLEEIASIYYDLDDYENALDYYEQYIEQAAFPDDVAFYYAGWCANELEEFEDAIDYFNRYDPEDVTEIAKKFSEIGYAYYKLDRASESIVAYLSALTNLSDYGPALRGLGDTYYELSEDYDQAIYYYEKAVKYDIEKSEYLYYDLGWLYNDAERYDDAVAILAKAIQNTPDDADVYVEHGYANYMLDKNDDALWALKKAVELDAESNLGYYYLGLNYLDMDRKNDAIEAYNKLKPLNNDRAEKLLQEINEY
ncbi:MAG: tetratricopeptide repeat protein [Chitinophagales bacterium]